jgi:hypothetical protein
MLWSFGVLFHRRIHSLAAGCFDIRIYMWKVQLKPKRSKALEVEENETTQRNWNEEKLDL